MKILKLVLIRHGQSKWNKANKFTGWTDINLSQAGQKEVKKAGQILKKNNFLFDFAYTSVLKRAIHTLWIILNEIDQIWLPIEKNWRLNERHYGKLQGLNKEKMIKKYGYNQVHLWRRDFKSIPPALNINDLRYPGYDIRYKNLKTSELPVSESLEITMQRVIPYWKNIIEPKIIKGEKIIIVAHGNSLRALIKYLNKFNTKEIMKIDIPTAIPLIYEFNQKIQLINKYYLNN